MFISAREIQFINGFLRIRSNHSMQRLEDIVNYLNNKSKIMCQLTSSTTDDVSIYFIVIPHIVTEKTQNQEERRVGDEVFIDDVIDALWKSGAFSTDVDNTDMVIRPLLDYLKQGYKAYARTHPRASILDGGYGRPKNVDGRVFISGWTPELSSWPVPIIDFVDSFQTLYKTLFSMYSKLNQNQLNKASAIFPYPAYYGVSNIFIFPNKTSKINFLNRLSQEVTRVTHAKNVKCKVIDGQVKVIIDIDDENNRRITHNYLGRLREAYLKVIVSKPKLSENLKTTHQFEGPTEEQRQQHLTANLRISLDGKSIILEGVIPELLFEALEPLPVSVLSKLEKTGEASDIIDDEPTEQVAPGPISTHELKVENSKLDSTPPCAPDKAVDEVKHQKIIINMPDASSTSKSTDECSQPNSQQDAKGKAEEKPTLIAARTDADTSDKFSEVVEAVGSENLYEILNPASSTQQQQESNIDGSAQSRFFKSSNASIQSGSDTSKIHLNPLYKLAQRFLKPSLQSNNQEKRREFANLYKRLKTYYSDSEAHSEVSILNLNEIATLKRSKFIECDSYFTLRDQLINLKKESPLLLQKYCSEFNTWLDESLTLSNDKKTGAELALLSALTCEADEVQIVPASADDCEDHISVPAA